MMGENEIETVGNGQIEGGKTPELGMETYGNAPETALSGLKTPGTLTEARVLLATLTTGFLAGSVKESTLRACTYSLNGLIKALHLEKAAELERRVNALEKLRTAK
jgi:hypothetical protein